MVPYTLVLALPTVILNSSAWGQADSIYTAWLMVALWHLLNHQNNRALVFFGVALAFKLQAILLLPFFFYVYWARHDYRHWYQLSETVPMKTCVSRPSLFSKTTSVK